VYYRNYIGEGLMGRPKKDKSKSCIITFRVTKEQKEILEMIAEYGGMDLSDLMRLLCSTLIYRFKMGLPIVFHEVVEHEDKDNVSISKEEKG